MMNVQEIRVRRVEILFSSGNRITRMGRKVAWVKKVLSCMETWLPASSSAAPHIHRAPHTSAVPNSAISLLPHASNVHTNLCSWCTCHSPVHLVKPPYPSRLGLHIHHSFSVTCCDPPESKSDTSALHRPTTFWAHFPHCSVFHF